MTTVWSLYKTYYNLLLIQGVSKVTYQYTGIIAIMYWYVSFETSCKMLIISVHYTQFDGLI